MRDFAAIIAMAADRKGGLAALEAMLADTPSLRPADIAAMPDDRILAAMKSAGVDHIDHLVLTHYHKDHAGGVKELASKVRESRPTAKVLFMSGYADEAVVRNGSLDAAAPFLEKPFSSDELARRVRDVLDGEPAAVAPRA